MARKPTTFIQPDSDDLDGQGGSTIAENGGISAAENGAGSGALDPATLDGGSVGSDGPDEYVRDASGTILRNKDGSAKRKRGRKRGSSVSGTQSRQAGNTQNLRDAIDSLASMIGFVHIGISTVTKCPEMELAESETKALAGATAKVMEQFDMTPDPRITAVVGLLTTAGTIYVPRYYLIQSRRNSEKKERRAQSGNGIDPMQNVGAFDANVFPLGGGNG